MLRNIDLEQNILFSITESEHLISQIKILKKDKILQILKLIFLLQVKVIFFQHDFAKNTNWLINESSVSGLVQIWKSLKLLVTVFMLPYLDCADHSQKNVPRISIFLSPVVSTSFSKLKILLCRAPQSVDLNVLVGKQEFNLINEN